MLEARQTFDADDCIKLRAGFGLNARMGNHGQDEDFKKCGRLPRWARD